jgi:D-glycero-D-manno-heptose 1,7-bisphosphate phosphatase
MSLNPASQRRALFLDRDGVINVNYGYVHSSDRFEFIDGIFEFVAAARSLGYLVVVVTNQSGIGRGYYSEASFYQLTGWMCEQFDQNDAHIDRVYFSPFHPTEGIGEYRRQEETRKPGPGMILRAQSELGLSLKQSVLIGDQPSDVLAGFAAGVGTNILLSCDPHWFLTFIKVYLTNIWSIYTFTISTTNK